MTKLSSSSSHLCFLSNFIFKKWIQPKYLGVLFCFSFVFVTLDNNESLKFIWGEEKKTVSLSFYQPVLFTVTGGRCSQSPLPQGEGGQWGGGFHILDRWSRCGLSTSVDNHSHSHSHSTCGMYFVLLLPVWGRTSNTRVFSGFRPETSGIKPVMFPFALHCRDIHVFDHDHMMVI